MNVNIITTFIYYNKRVFILGLSGSLAAALLIMQNLSALGLAAFTVQVILPLATPYPPPGDSPLRFSLTFLSVLCVISL